MSDTLTPPLAPVVGGVYRSRCGNLTGIMSQLLDGTVFTDGSRTFTPDGRLSTGKGPGHTDHDLVELVGMVVPIQTYDLMKQHTRRVANGVVVSREEYLQLHRAQSACEELFNGQSAMARAMGDKSAYQKWVDHRV